MAKNEENSIGKTDFTKDIKGNTSDVEYKGVFQIIADGRTNPITKLFRLVQLMFDLIFILLIVFAGVFFYLKSIAGWVLLGLAIIRYVTKND